MIPVYLALMLLGVEQTGNIPAWPRPESGKQNQLWSGSRVLLSG